jgi:hypothetical protein
MSSVALSGKRLRDSDAAPEAKRHCELSQKQKQKLTDFIGYLLFHDTWSQEVTLMRQIFASQLWNAIQHDIAPSAELQDLGFRWGPDWSDNLPVRTRVCNFLHSSKDIGSDFALGPNFRGGMLIRLQEKVKSILNM